MHREKGGGFNRLMLTDFRKRASRLGRTKQDAELKRLQTEGKIVLMRNDNPFELTAADNAAALMIAGNPRHFFYRT
jgi:hypothetical protein